MPRAVLVSFGTQCFFSFLPLARLPGNKTTRKQAKQTKLEEKKNLKRGGTDNEAQ